MMGLDFFRGMSSNMATGNGTTQSEEVSSWAKTIFIVIWLVVSTPQKNMKVSWDYYSQYMEK